MSTTDDIGTTAPSPDQIDPATRAEVEQALGAARPLDIPHAETPAPVSTPAAAPNDIPQPENPPTTAQASTAPTDIPQPEPKPGQTAAAQGGVNPMDIPHAETTQPA